MRFLSARSLVLRVVPALLMYLLISTVGAQGLPSFTGQGPSPIPSQLLSPSNPLGAPGSAYGPTGSDTIPLSSGMLGAYLPRIPNLELGFLYYFGNRVNTGRFTADYVLPFHLGYDSVLFGEAHAEGWDFWKRPTVSVAAAPGFTVTTSNTNNRVDLSFGGGYRTILAASTLLGVNGFYDTSRLFNKWYSSGGVGLEFAANVAGDDAIDLNFNWYGNLFNRDVLINAFRNQGNSFDVEAGYSHALFNRSLDLRLKIIGYQFDLGTAVRGWRGGADVTTRDGVFALRYEYGNDPIDGDYNTVGGFVTVGLQLGNILKGESPFTLPEPVFKSPRDLRRLLGLKVKRNWHQPAAVVVAKSTAVGSEEPHTFLVRTIPDQQFSFNQPPGTGTLLCRVVAFVEPPVPISSLDLTKTITISYSYAFDAPPSTTGTYLFARLSVEGGNYVRKGVEDLGNILAGQSGTVTETLPQSVFQWENSDQEIGPWYVYLCVNGNAGTTNLALTDWLFEFNQ